MLSLLVLSSQPSTFMFVPMKIEGGITQPLRFELHFCTRNVFFHVGAKFLPKSGSMKLVLRLHFAGNDMNMLSEFTSSTFNSPILSSLLMLQLSLISQSSENPNG
jgi:hypothetical protein